MNSHFKAIEKNELQDFVDECEARGINPKEFELNEHEILETELTPTTCIISGKVTISKGQISKTYSTGQASDWIAAFAKDLREGVFS